MWLLRLHRLLTLFHQLLHMHVHMVADQAGRVASRFRILMVLLQMLHIIVNFMNRRHDPIQHHLVLDIWGNAILDAVVNQNSA